MSEVLTRLLEAELIENIDGDEARFEKIEKAASAVAKEFLTEPKKLIPAILAGINPDITIDDPAIELAKKALVVEWKTMSSAYPSPPVNLFRAILLEACRQAANDGYNAAILWLTAVDTFGLMRLGKEEVIVRDLLESFAEATESLVTHSNALPKPLKEGVIKLPEISQVEYSPIGKIDRNALHPKLGDSVGVTHIKLDGSNSNGGNPTTCWPNSNATWAGEFAVRMTEILGDQFDYLAKKIMEKESEIVELIGQKNKELTENIEKTLNEQRIFTQRVAKSNAEKQSSEQTRLNVLWWSEALYSSPIRKSYRELEPKLAVALMPIDLLKQISLPAPASVSYMLSETVCKLTNVSFDKEEVLQEVLVTLRDLKGVVPNELLESFVSPPDIGFLTLRDLVVLALTDQSCELDTVAKRAGIKSDFRISLPVLSRAIFRQEQALILAEVD
ncbi:hypothetical protein L8S13_01985 [Vibrio lentus]|uniref:GTPase-associated system all-helical protein GASH n=1 Tax=Vibrio lentus TaxID=136468 RepID=UPI002469B9B4|nr:GTPase-associated system all-helical protein GASH [Vibrio lentus]MDH5925053.1 hypothetical protein [Vibrio lentus]